MSANNICSFFEGRYGCPTKNCTNWAIDGKVDIVSSFTPMNDKTFMDSEQIQ